MCHTQYNERYKSVNSLKFICCVSLLGITADVSAMKTIGVEKNQKKQQLVSGLKNAGLHPSQMYAIESAARESKKYQLDRKQLIQFNRDYNSNPKQACKEMMSYLIKKDLVLFSQQVKNLDPNRSEEFKSTINTMGITYGWPSLGFISQLCDNLPEHVSNLVREYCNIISGED